MSVSRKKSPSEDPPSLRHRSNNVNVVVEDYTNMAPPPLFHKNTISSSLDSIRILPRVPTGSSSGIEDVELSLLSGEERTGAGRNLQDGDAHSSAGGAKTTAMSSRDKKAMTLLIILYLIQGVPLGLALGSVPFILREHLSYSQLGVFALSNYPYSLKLLWSPIVDSTFLPSIGRRKSWIIPMQLIIGSLMLYIASNVGRLMENPADNIHELTFVFTSLVLFSATQDIAVDGEKWGIPRLELSTYLRFCSLLCFGVTFWLTFFETEGNESLDESEMTVTSVYKTIWNICKLKHVQSLIIMHFFAKIGFQANEAVTSLKMIEKGLGREDLAIVVLIDFPFQILGGWFAAKWSRGDRPLRPWIWAFWPRLAFAFLSTLIVYWFPTPPLSYGFFVYLIIHTVLQGLASTIQFVGISAFHTRISDPLIGGTYMTLLNTFTNLGGTWPKYFVLKGVDYFSEAYCEVKEAHSELLVKATECVSDHGKEVCSDIGGKCITERDGYYYVSALCMSFGVLFLVFYIIPTARKLQAVPMYRWRVSPE
ncbi:acetyl-coenzyme A transporter 1-domain-containing protein [Suillus americanus]|nr:acetyl-coenzyme A transporter 1-domain-containing protein [Suillus americanus]